MATITKSDILRKIKQLGANGAHFLSREIRESLGLDVGPVHKNERARLHNILKGLVNEKIIEEVPGGRRRNKYFRIANEEKLKLRVQNGFRHPSSPVQNDSSRSGGSGADRLNRIEEHINALNEKMDQLITMWS